MMLSVIPNISLAANNQTGGTDWGGLIKTVLNAILDVIKSLINIGTTNNDFYKVAGECKKVIDSNNFTYGDGWVGVPFSNDDESQNNPASKNRQSKVMDCSGYVSWVLYKYGCKSGKGSYKTIFSEQRGTKQMQILLPANPTLFKK
ncbi:MAG: hypothetical protein E7310_01315 [Clostridiales bacterium]|nr:hypothetical protein [Clostridiales bacterium]